MTRKRMQALRFSKDEIDAVAKLVELHLRFHGYGSGEWTDSAVRRYVRDAGDQLERLHVLTRADCTTRNRAKAERLRRTYDDLEARIARLQEQEELDSIRPDLDGNQIMELLGIPPGREVGAGLPLPARAAPRPGPLSEDAAKAALLEWWAARRLARAHCGHAQRPVRPGQPRAPEPGPVRPAERPDAAGRASGPTCWPPRARWSPTRDRSTSTTRSPAAWPSSRRRS